MVKQLKYRNEWGVDIFSFERDKSIITVSGLKRVKIDGVRYLVETKYESNPISDHGKQYLVENRVYLIDYHMFDKEIPINLKYLIDAGIQVVVMEYEVPE